MPTIAKEPAHEAHEKAVPARPDVMARETAHRFRLFTLTTSLNRGWCVYHQLLAVTQDGLSLVQFAFVWSTLLGVQRTASECLRSSDTVGPSWSPGASAGLDDCSLHHPRDGSGLHGHEVLQSSDTRDALHGPFDGVPLRPPLDLALQRDATGGDDCPDRIRWGEPAPQQELINGCGRCGVLQLA